MKKLAMAVFAVLIYSFGNAQPWEETQKIIASDREERDQFGSSVSISGDYVIISATYDDHDVVGSSPATFAGSAHIYQWNNGTWNFAQKLIASDFSTGDRFGHSVSISGNYAIVGAFLEDENVLGGQTLSASGSAYIFEKDTAGNWVEVQKIVASDRNLDDHFGWIVSISGNYAVVGARFEDEDETGSNYHENAGSAYIFERDSTGTWNETQKIVASDRDQSDRFGHSISISGSYVVVGAFLESHNEIGMDSLLNSGSAYLFERDAFGSWNEVKKLVAADRGAEDFFGNAVAINNNYVVIGAYNEEEDAAGGNPIPSSGSSYIFEKNAVGDWNQVQKIVASDRGPSDYGSSVAINGNMIIIGADHEEEDVLGNNNLEEAGAAYLYKRDAAGTWVEMEKIVNSDRDEDDAFGFAVAIQENMAIIGSPQEDHDLNDANPLQRAGSVYFFEYCAKTTSNITLTECFEYVSPSGNYTWTSSGIYTDSIVNTNGCDSIITVNLTIDSVNLSQTTLTECFEYVSPSGNYIWTSSGTYIDSLLNTNGCDSVVTINLTIDTVDVLVSQSWTGLSANDSNATYQWLECESGYTIINGATEQNFLPIANGGYAVSITKNGCTDTSICYAFSTVGIDGDNFSQSVSVYPNPTSGVLMIDLGQLYKDVDISIRNILGQTVHHQFSKEVEKITIQIEAPSGIYLLDIQTKSGKSATLKVILE